MLKKIFSFLMIGALFSTTVLSNQIKAQSLTNRPAEYQKPAASNLRQIFAKISAEDSTRMLDVKKFENDYRNPARQKFSDGQKTALYLGIAAAAAIVLVLVVSKNGKQSVNGYAYAGCPGNPFCQ